MVRQPPTPIPSSPEELAEAVARIEEGVGFIRTDLIPPIARSALEARDGLLRLTEQQKVNKSRLKRLEDAPDTHPLCDQVVDAQQKISGQERELAGLSKWRWWLMGLLTTSVILATGWAFRSNNDLVTVRTEATATDKALERHDEQLKLLEDQRRRDLEEVVRQVKAVPHAVRQSIPEPSVQSVLDTQELTEREMTQVRQILKRAEKRNGHSR